MASFIVVRDVASVEILVLGKDRKWNMPNSLWMWQSIKDIRECDLLPFGTTNYEYEYK